MKNNSSVMKNVRKAVQLIPGRDNVATALQPLNPGDEVELKDVGIIVISDVIPFGHKFATISIKVGDPIIKYGHVIGHATSIIEVGEHVHVHNVAGKRGRGDLARQAGK
jgi:altronate dehydratase small subunit